MKADGFVEKINFNIEQDMRPKAYADDDSYSTKVFKSQPLIGDIVISEAALDKMHTNVERYINTALNSREKPRYKPWLYEQVAIVVVNYAKQWNSNEEGKFSRYIALQFGYKDDSGKIWRIITEALDIAFHNNGKYFINAANGDRQFYETVMAHSFGPADSWMPLIDLLFKFYTENLDWNYVPGDPLFRRLVSVLRKRFDNTTADDDNILIASNYYQLRVGVRRLLLDRPGYCVHLFEQLVRRLHQLIHNEAKETKRHSLLMVDEWFVNRISNTGTVATQNKRNRKEQTEIALDYSKIAAKYILSNGTPAIRVPSFRLIDDHNGDAVARIFSGNSVLGSVELPVRGNELGQTIQGKTIALPTEKLTSAEIDCRVQISIGDSIIYDSEKALYRQLLIFSDDREISPSRIKREKYQLFVTNRKKLTGLNVDITPFANGMCEVAFHKNFALEYADNTIAIDTADIQGIRVVKPSVSEKASYLYQGETYLITDPSSSLKVYCTDEKTITKYCVQINDITHSLLDFFDRMSENRAVISFKDYGNGVRISVAIIDLALGTTIFAQKYVVIPGFSISFDRQFYLAENESEPAQATVTIGEDKQIVQLQTGTEASFEYLEGQVAVYFPCVHYQFCGIDNVFQGKYIRSADLDETAEMLISNHSALDCVVLIGDIAFQNESVISLGWLRSYDSQKSTSLDIAIEIAGAKRNIGRIFFEDQFLVQPKILLQNSTLVWDGGMSYIGDVKTRLTLTLLKNGYVCYSFPLLLGQTIVSPCESFDDGFYTCRFESECKILAEFSAFVGDEKKARFANATITVTKVTEDIENNATAVSIKPVYIDQIKYVDTCYVETEDDVFDVYTGCMYWVNYRGEKRYFSFKYNDARSKYKVNPVKIIFISNKYLRIVNEDDEGIFYFENIYSSNPGNEITDNEPSSAAKGYHDILFYLYTVDKAAAKEKASATFNALQPKTETPSTGQRSFVMAPALETGVGSGSLFSVIRESLQEEVITEPCSARILVNAGPGTGKTWTLIERIIHLLQDGVDPEGIQVLCFSRAAVEVVRQRMNQAILEQRVGVDSNKVDIRTFDSFATQLLYWVKDSEYREISSSFNIEALSYEDRILRFVEVLRSQPQLIEQCEHLIVDEVQDLVLSRAEMVLEIIHQLPVESGVTLFGDACQAIYDYQVEGGLGSEEFYKRIQETGRFSCYSFSKNYRQVSKLQEYCAEYREAILDNNIDQCNRNVAKIYEDLPDCTVAKLHRFQEDTLMPLTSKGNVGILTRSNAQALIISSIFRKKNILHTVQRRLAEDALNGWIALLFNQSPTRYYNEDDFTFAFNAFCSQYQRLVDPHLVWEAISDTHSVTTGRLSVKTLLMAMKHKGKCKGLFTEAQASNVTVSTIHRSKGREFDSVILLDSLLSAESDVAEEHRVNYVALSRAKARMYKVSLENAYYRTLEDRRCFTMGTSFKTSSHYLRFFEVGKKDDVIDSSFAIMPGTQKYIRTHALNLIGKEVYLKRDKVLSDGSVCYLLVLRENDLVLASTSQTFSADLCAAIRNIKNLPNYARVYEQLFPSRFSDIYIADIASAIGIAQGGEIDVVEHDGMVTWNTLLLEGYAKAEYGQET